MDKQKQSEEQPEEQKYSRRYFFELIGLGAIGIATAGSIILTTQFLSPNSLREPSLKFKAGSPEDYPPGSVTFNKEQKVFIIRAKEGYFYTLSAVCTHLGCIANWKSEEGIVACPCHGSKFNRDGKVIAGPAPRPLQRYLMTQDEHGNLIVDKGQVVSDEIILKV